MHRIGVSGPNRCMPTSRLGYGWRNTICAKRQATSWPEALFLDAWSIIAIFSVVVSVQLFVWCEFKCGLVTFLGAHPNSPRGTNTGRRWPFALRQAC